MLILTISLKFKYSMHISKVVTYIFLTYLGLFEVFNRSGEMSVVGCIYSGKYYLGISLVGEMSVKDVSGRGSVRPGCVCSGKCPSGMCLVREVTVGDVSG